MTFPQNNRTWQILHHARENNYAVGGFCVYNTDGVMAVIRAAEQKQSPAIIQLFPWTMHFQGPYFVSYVVQVAHSASVPISVHLDHCMKKEDIEVALTLPFDSIMIDASTADLEENVASCKSVQERAQALGITIEAELGRIDGEEDGVLPVDMQGLLTEPSDAKNFVQRAGVHFLAPSFGNVHGGYGEAGPEKFWQLDRLAAIGEAIRHGVPLVLHGTHGVSNEVLLKAVKVGVRKVNLNKTVRRKYTKFVAENAGKLELTALKMKAVEIYAREIAEMMDLLGSSKKA